MYWILIASLFGFALAYYARGFLAGRGQFRTVRGVARDRGQHPSRLCGRGRDRALAGGADFVAIGIATAPVACIVVLPRGARSGAPLAARPAARLRQAPPS